MTRIFARLLKGAFLRSSDKKKGLYLLLKTHVVTFFVAKKKAYNCPGATQELVTSY